MITLLQTCMSADKVALARTHELDGGSSARSIDRRDRVRLMSVASCQTSIFQMMTYLYKGLPYGSLVCKLQYAVCHVIFFTRAHRVTAGSI